MNLIEAMKVVHNRIKQVEPENIAKKIIGYLLYTQDNADHNMIRLAFYPDSVMLSVIDCVKHELAKGYHHILNFQDSMNRHDQKYPPRTTRRKLPEFPVINCHYFRKGYCKNGNNCRFFHVEEHVVSPGSLEKLEREIIELLKSRRGAPISIASLPMMYSEKYGKSLQAEGYLTESQRHGKAGYSLTKLLARLSNTIRLLDRPHGQHSVILAEDVSKFVESPGTILSSRQIYLTFPAESSFSENDVSNYFSKFGHVEDVRIPCQQKRMFGFVTFAYKETAKIILSKPNPHFISGAKVLVKPYQDKTRPTTRYLDHNNTSSKPDLKTNEEAVS